MVCFLTKYGCKQYSAVPIGDAGGINSIEILYLQLQEILEISCEILIEKFFLIDFETRIPTVSTNFHEKHPKNFY